MSTYALVLNASFEPIHFVSWQRAIQLLFQGKAEVVEESEREIRTVRFAIKVPSVLRLLSYIPLSKKRQIVRFSRENIFLRDSYQCQYCGKKVNKQHLTLDHVIPVVQGGKKSWENIVSSCKQCNQKKGGRTPHEAHMKLIRKPTQPTWLPRSALYFGVTVSPEKWKTYLLIKSPNDATLPDPDESD